MDIQQLLVKFHKWLDYDQFGTSQTAFLDSDELEELFEYFIEMSEYDLAQKVVDYGREMHPHDDVFDSLQVELYLACHMPQEALQLLEHMPPSEEPIFLSYFVSCYAQLGNEGKAQDYVRRIYSSPLFDPKRDLYEIGVSFNEADMPEYAIHFFKSAAEYEQSVDVYTAIAYCENALGSGESAIEYAEKAAACDPYSLNAWFCCMTCYLNNGQFAEAEKAIDYYLAIDDTDKSIYVYKLATLLSQNKTEQAAQLTKQIATEGSANDIARMASLYMTAEQPDTALTIFDLLKAEQIEQLDDRSVIESYLECMLTGKRYDVVVDYLDRHAYLLQEDSIFLPMKVDAYVGLEQTDKAIQFCHDNMHIFPARTTLANLLIDQDRAEEALDMLEQELKHCNDLSMYLMAAHAAWCLNDRQLSKKYFSKAMSINKKLSVKLATILNNDMADFFTKKKKTKTATGRKQNKQ